MLKADDVAGNSIPKAGGVTKVHGDQEYVSRGRLVTIEKAA